MRTSPEVILTTVSQDGFKGQVRGVAHQDLVETFFLSVLTAVPCRVPVSPKTPWH